MKIFSSKVLKYLILLALVLFIAAISSFWFSGPSFRDGDVVLEVKGPDQIASGGEATYKLVYQNNTRSTLYDLDFSFFFPEDSVVLTDGSAEEDYIQDLRIDELAPGEKGEKEFSAFLIGEKGNIRIFKTVLSFRAGNLRSSFEKTVSVSTTIVSTPIALTLVAPPSTSPDSDVNYILDYRNESGEDLVDLLLEFEYPDGFLYKNFDPQPTSGNNTWLLKSLKKGGGGRISINGLLKGQEGESKVVSVKLKRKVGGEFVDYQKSSTATVLSRSAIGVDILVNKSTDYSATLGDRLNYTIKYNNYSNVNFKGMNLSVKLEGDMFDINSLNIRDGYYDDSTRTITWSSSTIPEFENFGPTSNGEVEFGISLKSSFSSAVPGASGDRFVKAIVKLYTNNVPTGYEGSEVATGASVTTRIGTQPTFNQSVFYNDANFGSTGPFPLQVGEETYFTVNWQLTNPGNDNDNIKITSRLAAGAIWADMARAGSGLAVPTYNPNTFEVSWSLPKLPYGTGVFSPKYEASFRVKVKPSSTQKGTLLPLLDFSQFTGTDNFTKQSIIINKSSVTTGNLTDRPREGVVQ